MIPIWVKEIGWEAEVDEEDAVSCVYCGSKVFYVEYKELTYDLSHIRYEEPEKIEISKTQEWLL